MIVTLQLYFELLFSYAAPACIFTEVDAIEKGTPAQLLVQMLTWPFPMKGLLET
jgi:hypothetical protein